MHGIPKRRTDKRQVGVGAGAMRGPTSGATAGVGFARNRMLRPHGSHDTVRVAVYPRAAIACLLGGFVLACAGEPPVLGEPITVAESGATHPTVAIDGERGIYYSAWVGADGGHAAVWLARSTDGTSFETPVRVNDVDGDAAPHEQAPAQVAVAPDGTVYVAWQNNTHVPGRRFPYSDLRLARSGDAGQTFEPAVTVNDDAGTPASHTFHDITVAPDGTVYVSWIDGRMRAAAERELAALHADGGAGRPMRDAADNIAAASIGHADHETMPLPPAGGGREGGMDPEATLPPQEIRVARSTDGGRTFGANRVAAFDPCPCCRTSMAVAPNGDLLVAWRAIFGDNIRDIVVARSPDGGSTFDEPVRVHDDGWHINGCPHAGPSLAVAPDGAVHIAWYTGADGGAGVFHAVSRDGARTFEPPTPLLEREPLPVSRVRLAAAADGRVLAAWDDASTNPARPAVAWIDDGRVAADTLTTGGSFPVVAAAGAHRVVAWLAGDSVRVRTAR